MAMGSVWSSQRAVPAPSGAVEAHSTLSAAALGPDRAELSPERHRAHALVDELLQPLPVERLGRIDVALGIDRDAVHAVELAGLAATAAERGKLLHGRALDDAHALVHSVGQ